jgi:hypothetical protein
MLLLPLATKAPSCHRVASMTRYSTLVRMREVSL